MSGDEEPDQAGSPPPKRHPVVRILLGAFALVRGLVYLLGLAWAAGAICYDGPFATATGNMVLAIVFLVLAIIFIAGLVKPMRRFVGWVLVMALVIVPWTMIKPSDEGDWPAQWSRPPWAARDGDAFTFHDFRNFDYSLDGEVTERWEERTVHLANLQGLDYFHHAFVDSELSAHPVLSFDFGEEGHVAFSVETRRGKDEKFSVLKGLYKQFGLIYLVGDERDFIRDRSTHRNEPVRLYRSSYSAERIREMFLETVDTMNSLHEKPRFYHTITANCTTSYLAQAPAEKRARLDYRILLNGKLESLLYERNVIVPDGLSFEDLVNRAGINEAAKAAHHDPDFSAKIREGRPGF